MSFGEFFKRDWFSTLDGRKTQLNNYFNNLTENQILNTSGEAIGNHFYEHFSLEVPELQDVRNVLQEECDIDVSHDQNRMIFDRSRPAYIKDVRYVFEIPFTGNKDLFYIQPTSFSMFGQTYNFQLANDCLKLFISGANLNSDQIKAELEQFLEYINRNLENLRVVATPFNDNIIPSIANMFETRKQKLLQNNNILASLNIPIKPREGASKTYVAEVRKKIIPQSPSISNAAYVPEPSLDEGIYEHILNTLDNMTKVMETSPSHFAKMEEEHLRSHFLVQLNGQYEGKATGETFNYEGKTDICIKEKDRNIFVAECKFWTGEKNYLETIDQLLGYLSWRDTKAALIILNRNKDFSNVLKTIEDMTSKHLNFLKFVKKRNETSRQYLFSHKDDKNREIKITVMAFDVKQ